MKQQKRILIAVMITSFVGAFMGSSINVAVPAKSKSPHLLSTSFFT